MTSIEYDLDLTGGLMDVSIIDIVDVSERMKYGLCFATVFRVMLFNASNARNARKLHYTLQSDSDVINASAVCSVLISYGL